MLILKQKFSNQDSNCKLQIASVNI